MALQAPDKPSRKGGGPKTVVYRDAKGRTHDAKVLGPGTGSGLKLELTSRLDRPVLDNVPLATTTKSTGSYHHRPLGRR